MILASLTLLACSTEELAVRAMVHNPLTSIERDVDRTPRDLEVVERTEAGGYVYARGASGQWVVGLAKPFAPGSRIRIHPLGRATDFHSRRLDRTFDELWFVVIEGGG